MERIFYKTDLTDAYSGCPIYIFDTSYLPAPEDVDYDLFIPTVMQWLPKRPYVVILFSCGLNKINWVWGISFLKAFLSQNSSGVSNVENIKKIIAVHESWFVKSVSQIFTNFLVSRNTFANFNSLISSLKSSNDLLTSCDTLSDLSNYVDITHLKISLNVYRHDYQTTLSPEIALHCPFTPTITPSTEYSPKTDPVFFHHFYQIFNIVDAYGDQVELIFHKPGKKVNTDILFQCLMRNQVIWINDWDLNCVASCFKKALTEVSVPLIDTKKIALPMKDDLEYTAHIFDSMMTEGNSSTVLFQLVSLCCRIVENTSVTKHTSVSISRSLSHALAHESISSSSKDSISIVVRFLKNVLHHWPDIEPRYQSRFKTVQQIVDGEDLIDATIDQSYNMSYDITTHVSTSSDENDSLKIDTENILTSPKEAQNRSHFSANSSKGVSNIYTNERQSGRQSPEKTRSLPASKASDANPDSPIKKINQKSIHTENTRSLTDARTTPATEKSSIHIQFPPQKYKFEKHISEGKPVQQPVACSEERSPILKKPVIRGRKVGELTRIFEDRSQAMRILNTI